MEKGYKGLVVWQKADELAFQIYSLTRVFPKEEMYGMTSQLRRAGLSIPTNIVEGTGRRGKSEYQHFIWIAFASLLEVEYLLKFALRLRYVEQPIFEKVDALRNEVGALLWNFLQSFKRAS